MTAHPGRDYFRSGMCRKQSPCSPPVRRRAPIAAANNDRAGRQPRRHRSLAGARARRVPLVAIDFASRRLRRRIPPTSRALPTCVAALHRRGRRRSRPRAFHGAARRTARSSIGFSAAATQFRGSLRHAHRATATRPSNCCGSRSPSRASTPSGGAHPRPADGAVCSAQTTSPNDIANKRWWADGVSRASLWPAGRTARSNSVPHDHAPTICATYVRNVFARDTLKIGMVGDIDAATRRQARRPGLRRPARQGEARAGA